MASTIIDSHIFQGIFASDAMRAVWSDENRTQKYLDIERALAIVQGRLGLIPKEAADEIVSHCTLDQIDNVEELDAPAKERLDRYFIRGVHRCGLT